MDDNWRKVREIFDAAIRRQPEKRAGFVLEMCDGDQSLFAEVESLLSSHGDAESFLESPAFAEFADELPTENERLKPGKRFGHYEIKRLIGAGGMGEVYLAEDKRLDRQVAVKILNEKFSRDESNLNRFIREAKAASALNHPNILVIHEVGAEGETHYIVSEFIKGETLRERLRKSPLKLSEFLDVSIQVAGALAAAHEARLAHRDIKPENVMIRRLCQDFGLRFGEIRRAEQPIRSRFGTINRQTKQHGERRNFRNGQLYVARTSERRAG